MTLNLPNLLTWGRIALIPLLLIVYYLPERWLPEHSQNVIGAGIFVFAAITDWLDGYLARHLKHHPEDPIVTLAGFTVHQAKSTGQVYSLADADATLLDTDAYQRSELAHLLGALKPQHLGLAGHGVALQHDCPS